MSFEIIAIATKKRLDKKYKDTSLFDSIKVLKEDEVFKLNNDYSVSFPTKDSCEVEILRDKTKLYSRNKTQIQVNAIVGMNGSGKSTLSEILYLMLYNLAVQNQVMRTPSGNLVKEYKGELNAYLFLQKDKVVKCINFNIDKNYKFSDKKRIELYEANFGNKSKVKVELSSSFEKSIDLNDLFYLISLNYSLYGLNELNMGPWIKNIFHKNDMYEAPIVINPYREEGKINVNIESFQNNARLLSNLSKRGGLEKGVALSGDYFFSELKIFFGKKNRKEYKLTGPLIDHINSKKRVIMHQEAYHLGVNYNPSLYFIQDSQRNM